MPTTVAGSTSPNNASIPIEVRDPTPFLNEVASRYASVSRVLLEYVDNGLDDAEHLYKENDGKYPRKILIDVLVDIERRTVTITDNVRGMTQAVLEKAVTRVGESTKKGVSWLNGQFGFGLNAFRGAAEAIRFIT